MYLPFEKINENARVWVYQSNRPFDTGEIQLIEEKAKAFCDQWAAHGQALTSSFYLASKQFLILAVDESQSLPSGCSIDSSVALVRDIQNTCGVDMLDRSKTAFLINDEVKLFRVGELKQKVSEGVITADTLIVNTLVSDVKSFKAKWTPKSSETWMKRYFTSVDTSS